MKKFISVILAIVIMALSAFSAFAFDMPENITDGLVVMSVDNTDEQTAPDVTGTDENQPEEKRLAKDWIKEKAIEYSADVSLEMLGTPLTKGSLYRKGNICSVELPYKNTLTQKTIFCEDGTFMYFTQLPFFYIELNEKEEKKVLGEFLKSYEENGYYVEEYVNEEAGEESAFYFKDGELVYYTITFYYMDLVAVTAKYTITSYEVDDKDIRLPRMAANVTPIYNLLLLLGLIK